MKIMSDWLRMAPDSRALENQIYLGASFSIWNDLDLFGSKQKLVIMLLRKSGPLGTVPDNLL